MDDHRQVIKLFSGECMWAWIIRGQYRKLYEEGEDRLKLLDKVAGMFFHDIQTIMIEYIILQICKLTDSDKSCGNFNLSIDYLLKNIPIPPGKELELEQLDKRMKFFRQQVVDARRKSIAHSDLKTILINQTHGGFTSKDEKVFWDDLQEFVNIFHLYYCGGIHPITLVTQCDANDLVGALKKAVDYDVYFQDKIMEKLDRKRRMEYASA